MATTTSESRRLWAAYVAGMDAALAATRGCWRVLGYRGDVYPGRWEATYSTPGGAGGRTIGPYADPQDALRRCVQGNRRLAQKAAARAPAPR